MALTKISVTINNEQLKCGIELKATLTGVNATDIDEVKILRKALGDTYWTTIYDYDVEDIEDLEFGLLDITTTVGTKYHYSIDLLSNGSIVESGTTSQPRECWFEGMFVGNFNTQYLAPLDWEVSTERNTNVAYVNTLAGRTPYRVSNSNNNYDTGSASALFIPIVNEQLTPEYYHKYAKQVVDFLTDGTEKILKTGDGRIWCVSIDDAVSVPFDDRFKGRNIIEFNWTEIGDVPPFGMVKL